MKRMPRETFEYILSKLTVGETWTVQTMTEHGAAGGGYQLCRDELDGLISCNGHKPFPADDGSNDSVMWEYFTQGLKRWPRGKTPPFAYTPDQQKRALKRQSIRHARKWLERHDDFRLDLADNIFFGWKNDIKITEDDLRSMLQDYGATDLDFTPSDMLEFLKQGNNEQKLVGEYLW